MTFIRIGVRMKKEPKFSESLLSALLLHMFIPCDLRHLCCKKCPHWASRKRNLRKTRGSLLKVTELVNHRISIRRLVF